MSAIQDFLTKPHGPNWHEEASAFLTSLIKERFGSRALSGVSIRAPFIALDKAPFVAILKKDSPTSGGYGGTSFVLFPSETGSLFSLGVGTQGLAPDEDILGRPGHARFCKAYAGWANTTSGNFSAWSKADPTRTDIAMPASMAASLVSWQPALERYGNVLYVTVQRAPDALVTEQLFLALLDFYMSERNFLPLAAHIASSQAQRNRILSNVTSSPTLAEVETLLRHRRFLVLQGPPGTGKTFLANALLKKSFAGNGRSYQLHPSTSYEQFVGGLAPVETDQGFGFRPCPGILMRAAEEASKSGKPYLLHLDEINRADLAKILGEALFLFEIDSNAEARRKIDLPYDFGHPHSRTLTLPPNLFVVGTMNNADRSTAILDLAVRRRFAFVSMWPTRAALSTSHALAAEAFDRLHELFVREATPEELELMPGHSYFMSRTEDEARARLKNDLLPLLATYQRQGLVSSMSDALDTYTQWLATQ